MKRKNSHERAHDGKLLPGHVGLPGAGRPPKKVEQKYLETSYRNCSLKAWGRIVRRAVKDATRGDASARTWLSKHLGLENMKLTVLLPDQDRSKLDLARLTTTELQQLHAIMKHGTPDDDDEDEDETEHSKLH